MSKAILCVLGNDIQLAVGALQTCAGHKAGSEAAVHAMSASFKDEDTNAVLLVDATNAFNQLNRQAALHNISVLCPSFSTNKVKKWTDEVLHLSEIAKTHPHSAFVHGTIHKWNYVMHAYYQLCRPPLLTP